MSILIISPHPDDDVIGMGRTIAKRCYEGERVSCVYITNGAASPRNSDMSDLEMAQARRQGQQIKRHRASPVRLKPCSIKAG